MEERIWKEIKVGRKEGRKVSKESQNEKKTLCKERRMKERKIEEKERKRKKKERNYSVSRIE